MIQLVTQFDDVATRTAGATPSGASSSSSTCCCCVATIIGTTGYTALSVGSAAREAAVRAEPARRSRSVPIAVAAGAAVLPAAVGLGVALHLIGVDAAVGAAVALGAWVALLALVQRSFGARNWPAKTVAIPAVAAVAFVVEFAIGAAFADALGAYLALAVLGGCAAVAFMYSRLLGR